MKTSSQGILLLDKPENKTSFFLVKVLRAITGIKKIGHAGTLDPFATGLMVMLIGQDYTRAQSRFLHADKEYLAKVELGKTTDTYDKTGRLISSCSGNIPTLSQLRDALLLFQGKIHQTPPMYSAKKQKGKKLYELARNGIDVQRDPVELEVTCELLSYEYPWVDLHIKCSKGTYVRSIAHDLGIALKTGALLYSLRRIRCGHFLLEEAIKLRDLDAEGFDYRDHFKELI